ncbi:MAG: hypothetical protein WC000_12305 [Dokdonella sp.]
MNIKKVIVLTAEIAVPLIKTALMLIVLGIIALLAIPTFSRSVAKDVLSPAAITALCQESKSCTSGRMIEKAGPNGWKPVFLLVRAASDTSQFDKSLMLARASYLQSYFLKYGHYELKVTK